MVISQFLRWNKSTKPHRRRGNTTMLPLVIGGVALCVAVLMTGPKLFGMCQIKGWVPGATVRTELITQKWHEMRSEFDEISHVYWIAWGRRPIREVGDHRLNLEPEQWEAVRVGDRVEIIRVPGDSWPHTRDGIFVSPGNFQFDIGLLIAELIVAALSLHWWCNSRRDKAVPPTWADEI